MARSTSFTKRTMITEANKRVLIMTSVAAFLVVFCLVASKTLLGQIIYQDKVISQEEQAKSRVDSDLDARTSLANAYQAFTNTPQNVLGGNPAGTGSQDGSNTKIVLDALPSTYDFPAVATTLEALIKSQGLQITSITGTDEELQQLSNQSNASPQPVAMPLSFTVNGSYQSIENLINIMEASIRPMQIQTVNLTGGETDMTANISAETYFQAQKSFSVTKQEVQ